MAENDRDRERPDCFGQLVIYYDDGDCQDCQFGRECAEFANRSIDGFEE